VGVYGVIAYAVAQRVRELGVRVALGARPADVYRLVVGGGARLAAVGLAVGLALTLALTRVLAAMLHGVSATDPLVLGGTTAALGAAALLASWLPARRAVRLDPADVLRAD
jgi:ABC-type antimicrobial peptide transport system permease subunit